jgi:tRNA threonylcarbamoyladenosine biosynthesis protein TsaE
MYVNNKELIYTYDERDIVVQEIKKLMAQYQIFACVGPLGAGKTTIIGDVLRSCGVEGMITSPTFTYMHQYENNQQERFFHFDLYRIASVEEFQSQGFDEYLYQANSWAFIEWPEVIRPLLQKNVCWLSFDYGDEINTRKLVIQR